MRVIGILLTLAYPFAWVAAQASAPVGGSLGERQYDLHVPLTPQERAYLAGIPVLRIGMEPDWAPYAFIDSSGKMDGISADYLNYIVHTLHLKVKRVDSQSWSHTAQLANSDQIDLLAAASQDDHVTAPFLTTVPYIEYPEVIVTRKIAQPIATLQDLSHLRVAAVAGSVSGTAPGLDTSVNFERVWVSSADEGLRAVADGRVQAFVGNLGVVQRAISERFAGVLYVSGATGYSRSLSFGVAPRYEPLLALMNRVLEAVPGEDRERIQNTWLRASLQYGIPRRTLWQVLAPIGLVILVSIIILSVIIAYLRKEIRRRRWIEQELRFQIKFQQSLMATAPIPVFVKDLQGRYIAVNPAFEQMTGRKAEELIGRTAQDVHPQDVASNNQLEILTKQVLSSDELIHGELQYRSNSGDTHDVMYWLRLVNEEGQIPRAMLGTLVDVSALRMMERQQRAIKRQLMELTQVLPALLFQVRYTPGGGFVPIFISNYAERLTGLSQDTLMSSPERWLPWVAPSARWRLWRALLRARKGDAPVEQELVLESDERQVWVRLEAVCHRGAEQDYVYTGYLSDVTQLKLQTESLARAKQEAEHASRVKDVFLATMSHEIRTPMSGVIGVLDLMDRSRLHTDDRHLLDMARGAARTLLRILNDVLDFSKSQSGRLSIESKPFSLKTVVDDVTGLFAPEMRNKGLSFDVFVSTLVAPCYVGDGQRLAQVLLNLVGNALKFTDAGGIGVVVEALPVASSTRTQQLSITVRDTGIGIEESAQAQLFEPFVQVGSRQQGGTGLGLAICKRLIQAMNGDIRLRSEPGKGTSVEISLTLPVEPDRPPIEGNGKTQQKSAADLTSLPVPAGQAEPLGLSIPAKSILLVEDQPINRELLARQFLALGVQTFEVAENGLEAWQAFEKHPYQLVITDCAMPLMDGEALIRQIRASEANTGRRAHVIALTANAMELQHQTCIEAGADGVMIKPIDLDQLKNVLRQLFNKSEGLPTGLKVELPAGIPAAEWPELRKRILGDMEKELTTVKNELTQQNAKRAWEAAHRIVGTARWFKLSGLASSASALQAALDEKRSPDAEIEALQVAIATFAEAT